MPVLNFKEISEAHIADGKQDDFELLARDFLEFLGYKILSDPDRGADGGKDIIVQETRNGVGGETILRWLVSCKHKASSGKSVSANDDSNILDRVMTHKCDGFIGFYSTLASSGLGGILSGLEGKIEQQVFDREKIENHLLKSAKGLLLAKRFFPKSISDWQVENPQPAKVFSDVPSLKCHVCHQELLGNRQDAHGIVTIWEELAKTWEPNQPRKVEFVYWTCKGLCDDRLKQQMNTSDLIDDWEDISDYIMPIVYIKSIMGLINGLNSNVRYSQKAFEAIREFHIQIYPFVARHLNHDEKERVDILSTVPSYLGGLGEG